jgi:hypothetical protein
MMIVIKNMDIEEKIHYLLNEWYSANLPIPDSILMHPSLYHPFVNKLMEKYGPGFISNLENIIYEGFHILRTTGIDHDEIRIAKTKP